MNTFKALMKLLGLRDQTAGDFLNLKPKTVDKMASGSRDVPVGIIQELLTAYKKVDDTASELSKRINAIHEEKK